MTSKDFFSAIQIVHLALMTGVIFPGVLAFYFHYSGFEMKGGEEMNLGLIYIVPVFTVAGVFASKKVFQQKLKDCIAKPNLKEKLDNYRSALILKFALIEGSSFFALIAYFFTGKLLYLGFAGLLLVVLISYRPSKEKLIIDLELNQIEKQLIYDSNAIID